MQKRTVAVNEQGRRLGEDHHHAKLSNAEVGLIRELHEAGMSYALLAEKFEVSKSAIAGICRYERRGDTPTRWKEVHVTQNEQCDTRVHETDT